MRVEAFVLDCNERSRRVLRQIAYFRINFIVIVYRIGNRLVGSV